MTFFYQDKEGIHEKSKEDFLNVTGSQWTDEVILSTPTEDASFTEIDWQHMRFLIPLYRFYKKHPAKLYIRLGSSKGNHSAHALEKIEKAAVVVEYVGEWIPSPKQPSTYRWGSIDALKHRNYSGIIEDGFPNIAPFYLYNVEGVPIRVIFVALEEIKPGEMLTVNYGMNHSVKFSYHTEYKLESMLNFFMKSPLEKIFNRIKELRSSSPRELGWKRTLELEGLTAKLRYLYHTPGAIVHLLIKGVVKIEEIFYFYEQPDFRYYMMGFAPNPSAREKEVIRYLEVIKRVPQVFAKEGFDIINKVRQRIFFLTYLRLLEEGTNQACAEKEAFLWNEAFDFIDQEDKPALEFKFDQVIHRERLIQASLNYAIEIHSPLVSWLQSLTQPPLPLRPTG